MSASRKVSAGAFISGVLVAFLVGVLASLAIRPPGGAARVSAAAEQVDFEPLRWRLTSAFNANLPVFGAVPQQVADTLRELSGGAIEFTVFDPGMIVPALEITEAVKEGKLQAGFQWVGYDQGRIPASTLISAVPFGMEPTEFAAWWYFGGGRELGEALYAPHNVMPIVCTFTVAETAGWFREPIESLDDLVGLKIRFAGLGGKVLQRLGASVTMIPASEIFQALEKGAIDATEFSMPVVDRLLGFGRVATYNYFPGWHQTFSAGHLQVNLDAWNALQPRTQALIRTTCQAAAMRTLAESEALQGPVLRDFEAEGVVTEMLPVDVLEKLREVTREVLEEEAARDEHFARILASQQAFSETYRYWKTRGYLPRSF